MAWNFVRSSHLISQWSHIIPFWECCVEASIEVGLHVFNSALIKLINFIPQESWQISKFASLRRVVRGAWMIGGFSWDLTYPVRKCMPWILEKLSNLQILIIKFERTWMFLDYNFAVNSRLSFWDFSQPRCWKTLFDATGIIL